MGSAAGRRKCCEYYYVRGYNAGWDGTGRWAGNAFDAPWDDRELYNMAGTVSTMLAGLYRSGLEQGAKDREKANRRRHPYYDYRVQKAGAQDILNLLDDGFLLRYERSSGWPDHPFIVRSQPGGIVYRRTAVDLSLAQDADYYKHRKLLEDTMAEAIDAGAFDKRRASG